MSAATFVDVERGACVCCAFAIANGDACACPPDTHPEIVGGAPMGAYVLTGGADDDAGEWFAWAPCGVCGSTLGGDRMPVAYVDGGAA